MALQRSASRTANSETSVPYQKEDKHRVRCFHQSSMELLFLFWQASRSGAGYRRRYGPCGGAEVWDRQRRIQLISN